jgi:hypothetical protein
VPNIFESRIIVRGADTELVRFKAAVGKVTPMESNEGPVQSGDFAFKFDERAMPDDLYRRWVEDFPTLTFDIACVRDDFECNDYFSGADGKLVRGERWF